MTMNVKPQPWPLWPTLGFSTLIIGTLLGASTAIALVAIFIVMAQTPGAEVQDFTQIAKSLETNGLLLAISTLVADTIGIGLIYFFVRLRRSITVPQYLGLRGISVKTFVLWHIAFLGFLVLSELSMKLFHQSDQFMVEAFTSAHHLVPLFIAVVLVGPLFEELLFRGFMIPGIARSSLGPTGAVLISSGIWAVIHLQYNLFFMGILFGFGLLLGIAQLKTRSLYLPLAMHSLNNLIAFVGAALTVR
ncbi:hypothetical protein C1752_03929 [Acaryochloris thomasi RCC1774]|uniref:CAAX prenyl protease 2/Lysostaphin resistance protein A-like domain-containing protein n=1 Tax=Acaryochloris thomasi RCC1774 TaxID=1764569 RepID=A0A2W1JN64_9CYAN|nr:CPBP family intramembrane glutamic endopeptidase [Acaryochloris thomasi]PZD72342.1 hypothetical protein C1752_03929 [Acaryochloris thomasi RCC1774]